MKTNELRKDKYDELVIGDIVRIDSVKNSLYCVSKVVKVDNINGVPTTLPDIFIHYYLTYVSGEKIFADDWFLPHQLILIKESAAREFVGKSLHKDTNFDTMWEAFIKQIYIPITGKNRTKTTTISEKTKKNFNKILKAGYTSNDFKTALKNAMKCETLDIKYITPEYITRPDKFEHWLNVSDNKEISDNKSESYKDFQDRMYGRK